MKDTIFVQPDEEGKLSKFKIGDQEFTQDDILSWKNGHMMQNDQNVWSFLRETFGQNWVNTVKLHRMDNTVGSTLS